MSLYNALPPSTLFDIKECVGSGNFGDVYRAINNVTKAVVAIKVVNLEHTDEDIDLLAQEIFFLAELRSPFITRYITTIMEDVSMWIVMEYCGGGSCADLIKTCYRNGIPEEKVSFITRCVLFGLQYLHEQMKIHRDIKAANILLTDKGTVKLGDFGVSGQLKATLKRDTFVGTPYWMAPEIINKDYQGYDEKADIWSLGITVYELVKGLPPLAKYDPVKVMASLPKRKPPELHGHYSGAIKRFIACCLMKEPKERLSAKELLSTEFILFYENRVLDLKADVDVCREIKLNQNSYIKRPKFRLSDKFYNTLQGHQWDFDAVPSLQYSKNNKQLITPNPESEKISNFATMLKDSNKKNQTITPTSMNSKSSFKDKNILESKVSNNYELGSGMDIDTDSQIRSNIRKGNNVEKINYFKNVICYSIKRMDERANDANTRASVNALLNVFTNIEAEIPGFSDVFMEEMLVRIDSIGKYILDRS